MKRFRLLIRRHMSPLAGDTASMLDLPPVRMGLLAKLNLLTIGLIFLSVIFIMILGFGDSRYVGPAAAPGGMGMPSGGAGGTPPPPPPLPSS